jgi:hypothetical protein
LVERWGNQEKARSEKGAPSSIKEETSIGLLLFSPIRKSFLLPVVVLPRWWLERLN